MYRTCEDKIDTAYLQWLKDKGILTKMYKYGYINHLPSATLETRLKVDALMRQGRSRGEAVRSVATTMRCCLKTVYSYLYPFK